MKMETKSCPNGHGEMALKSINRTTDFRKQEVTYQFEAYVCGECGIEVATIEQTAKVQAAIADAYRKKEGLLTSTEIREKRNNIGLSQQKLAEKMNIGVASVKRWEGGLIQSKIMDKALRLAFEGQMPNNIATGNRPFSIPRVKAVLCEFERCLGRKVLKKHDKMLFAAKYAWYADMVAHRELGRSMTGASYAALPLGPQLNNYNYLVDEIRSADENSDEPLTREEVKIINRIAKPFPSDRSVLDAAHREKIWQSASTGAPIPYSDSARLTEI